MHKLVKASRGNCHTRLICFPGDGGVDGRCDDHDGAGRASGRPHSAGCRRGGSGRRRAGSVSWWTFHHIYGCLEKLRQNWKNTFYSSRPFLLPNPPPWQQPQPPLESKTPSARDWLPSASDNIYNHVSIVFGEPLELDNKIVNLSRYVR